MLRKCLARKKIYWRSVGQEILGYFDPLKREWGQNLRELGYQRAQWSAGGSLVTGLCLGAKPSQNPKLAATSERFLEWDGMLYIDPDKNPQDPAVMEEIMMATGLSSPKLSNRVLWGEAVKRCLFYGYFDVPGLKYRVEAELAVSAAPEWLEVADHWSSVFSPEERDWQAMTRQQIRNKLRDEALVEQWKAWQVGFARWAIYAGFASGNIPGQTPKFLSSLVANWFKQPIPQQPEIPIALPKMPPRLRWVEDAIQQASLMKAAS